MSAAQCGVTALVFEVWEILNIAPCSSGTFTNGILYKISDTWFTSLLAVK